MSHMHLEQAFAACRTGKTAWLNSKAALAKAELDLQERELTCHAPEPDTLQALRDTADRIKREVCRSAGDYIRAHEAVQRISMHRQLRAFMDAHGATLTAALAPELMHLHGQPDIVRERALDRAAAGIREALSVYLASGVEIDYAEDDREILTAIGFRPDRGAREDIQVKKPAERHPNYAH